MIISFYFSPEDRPTTRVAWESRAGRDRKEDRAGRERTDDRPGRVQERIGRDRVASISSAGSPGRR